MIVGAGLMVSGTVQAQTSRPNIVLMFPDNLGWGEVGVYGGVRGQLTPRIDKLAAEGIRLNNFNVEFSCVVSRAALMTGRYAVRTGATQPRGHDAVGGNDCRGAEVDRLRDGALRQVASRRRSARGKREPIAAGIRRVLRHPAHEQRSADDDRAGADGARHLVHLGRQDAGSRRATSSRSTWTRAGTVDRESADRSVGVHGAQRPRSQALLPLLPDHADSLPDAGASRLRRQDRRRRHRRCDGRDGRQRRPRARCDSIDCSIAAQHDRPLVHRQRRRAAAAVARIGGTVVGLLQHA